MKIGLTRRQVMNTGIAAGIGSVLARFGYVKTVGAQALTEGGETAAGSGGEFSNYSRYRPSYGGPPSSDQFLGKLVPGLRRSGLGPVPVEAPD